MLDVVRAFNAFYQHVNYVDLDDIADMLYKHFVHQDLIVRMAWPGNKIVPDWSQMLWLLD